MKRRTVKADEYDVISSWRKFYCYLARPGATSKIKNRMRRRERHDANHAIGREE